MEKFRIKMIFQMGSSIILMLQSYIRKKYLKAEKLGEEKGINWDTIRY